MSDYVKVSDIWEVLDEKAFNKDDEIFQFAKGLIQWVIDKRAVPAVPVSVLEGIKAELKEIYDFSFGDDMIEAKFGLRTAINLIDEKLKKYTESKIST